MRLFSLDARLAAIADEIPSGAVLYDVGTDHARLPVYLIYKEHISAAVASDVAELPLETARRTAARFGVTGRMRFELCDGIPPSAAEDAEGCVVIAGMGGETIAGILDRAGWTARSRIPLVLQPMSKSGALYEFLAERYEITSERHVADGRREYLIIKARGALCREGTD